MHGVTHPESVCSKFNGGRLVLHFFFLSQASVPAPVNDSVKYIPHLRYELLYKKLLLLDYIEL